MTTKVLLVFCLLGHLIGGAEAPAIGPANGCLVIVGGGGKSGAAMKRFFELAGGADAPLVIIPTAEEKPVLDPKARQWSSFSALGFKNIAILHTTDRAEADTEAFVKPLRSAKAVWFGGGRQWRITDAYLNTLTQKEIAAVLERGGVIGGSSAGATIQGSYLVRGDPQGNTVMMSPGHEIGFGYLKNSAIDQHVIARHRENDLREVIAAHPDLLGIGIDENTAIVVRGDAFEVVGPSRVLIHDHSRGIGPDGKSWFALSSGDRFDLATRKILR